MTTVDPWRAHAYQICATKGQKGRACRKLVRRRPTAKSVSEGVHSVGVALPPFIQEAIVLLDYGLTQSAQRHQSLPVGADLLTPMRGAAHSAVAAAKLVI